MRNYVNEHSKRKHASSAQPKVSKTYSTIEHSNRKKLIDSTIVLVIG